MQLKRACPYVLADDREKPDIQRKTEALSRYSFKFKRKQKQAEAEQQDLDDDGQPVVLKVGSHAFHSCPVALLLEKRALIELTDLIFWSEESHLPLLEGGLLRHTKFYYQIRQTVVGEQHLIEREEHERSKQGADKNSQINRSKPARNSKRAPRRR